GTNIKGGTTVTGSADGPAPPPAPRQTPTRTDTYLLSGDRPEGPASALACGFTVAGGLPSQPPGPPLRRPPLTAPGPPRPPAPHVQSPPRVREGGPPPAGFMLLPGGWPAVSGEIITRPPVRFQPHDQVEIRRVDHPPTTDINTDMVNACGCSVE